MFAVPLDPNFDLSQLLLYKLLYDMLYSVQHAVQRIHRKPPNQKQVVHQLHDKSRQVELKLIYSDFRFAEGRCLRRRFSCPATAAADPFGQQNTFPLRGYAPLPTVYRRRRWKRNNVCASALVKRHLRFCLLLRFEQRDRNHQKFPCH